MGWIARCALVTLALFLACTPKKPPPLTGPMPDVTDSPLELAADADLQEARDQYISLTDPNERSKTRSWLAEEYERRIAEALNANQRSSASSQYKAYLSLWSSQDLNQTKTHDFNRVEQTSQKVYAYFARTGGDVESVMALAALAYLLPDQSTKHIKEIETIFDYVDGLAVAKHGPGAEGARPIKILEEAFEAIPTTWVTNRLIRYYRTRQDSMHRRFVRDGADIRLLQLHGDSLLHTLKSIVRVLARSDRLSESNKMLYKLRGVGDDRAMRRFVQAALAAKNPGPWLELAAVFLTDPADHQAAIAICLHASTLFPNEASLRLAAAEAAWADERVLLAIRLYEEGLAMNPQNADASERLSELYTMRVGALASRERPQAAEDLLKRYALFHKKASITLGETVDPDLASAYATMGHGLASLGELPKAQSYLNDSLKKRINRDALHHKGAIALRKQDFTSAIHFFEQINALPAQSIQARFDHTKSLRLLAEAYIGAEQKELGEKTLREAALAWVGLFQMTDLPAPFLADALNEHGKLLWELGEQNPALVSFERAVRADPSGSAIHADIVAFLMMRGESQQALDTYYRALASPEIDNYFKVYMSLWVLAEAHRVEKAPDPHAVDYLRSRKGPLWFDQLAQYAVGEQDLKTIEAIASTRGRRAELLYYTAVLGRDADDDQAEALLTKVLETDMVLYFEYEMAQYWLKHGR